MNTESNLSNESKTVDLDQLKEKLNKTLENYDTFNVPNLADIMEQFRNKLIVIYGAGTYGSLIYHTLNNYGIQVKIFLDIKSQPGDKLFNIPMYKADDKLLDDTTKENATVIAALVKDYETRENIFDFIRKCGFKTTIDAQSLRCHWVYFDNLSKTDTISEHIKNQTRNILNCFNLFEDNQSRKIYCTNVIAHLRRNYENCIESVGSIQYFPEDIIFDKGYERFIDCGGYIGDTIDELVKHKGEIKATAIFEPIMESFSKLSVNMEKYSLDIPELFLYPCAVSNKTEILFMDYEGGSSTLSSENKENCVQGVSIDDVLKNFAPTFIKMDVEGAELKTIIGAENNIKEYRPDLAICVYHCINHLWDIALLLNSWNLGYKFYLRTHNSFTMETVLYATSREEGK